MKNKRESKTMIFNVIVAVLDSTVAGLHMLEPMMSDNTFLIVQFVVAQLLVGGNMYLRSITTGPVKPFLKKGA